MDDLTAPERDVLVALTASMATKTVVTLAADLYGRQLDTRFDRGDPVGFCVMVLEGLAERGLVKYRIREGRHPEGEANTVSSAYTGLPFDIRLTPDGWKVCGYGHFISQVGSRSRHQREVRPGDRTDYRTHRGTAEAGPAEIMTWMGHRFAYPHHIHNYQLFSEDNMSDTRAWTRITPELEERVVHSFARTGSHIDTGREVNLTPRQVKYALAKHNDALSLKERTLAVIREKGPFPNLTALYAELPGAHGMHNFVHVLHSLHKAGLIDFAEDGTAGRGGNYLDIRARTNGPVHEPSDIQVSQPALAEPVDLTPVLVVATPPAVKPTYPELERLFGLAVEALNGKRKATQWLAAAELLSDTDPETSDLLLQKATQAETTGLSPVESEYLAYVEAHPDSDDNPTG